MPVAESDQEDIIQLLLQDIGATLGPDHDSAVRRFAMNATLFADDSHSFRDRLVGDVQQHFHDCFIDTTWPACPRHSSHPLWLQGGSWYCERDGEALARLGELSSIWRSDEAG